MLLADIEEEEVGGVGRGGLSGEDTGLDGGTVGNSLIGVDALLELLAVEEVGKELLDAGNTGGTTNKDDLTTESTGVTGKVLLGLPGELFLEVVKEVGVEVLATQVGVTSGGLDSEDTTLDVEEGNIESTTTEIVDEDVALLLGLAGTETVGNGGSGGLVDDTENVEARDGTGVLGPRLDILLDGGVIESTTDQTLDIEDGVGGVHGGLVLGGLTDQTLLSSEGDERRGGERTLLVGD
ncbi:hypothetical protein D6C80_02412 [Aureobasidium pullulans]|nr:hypothetical protein D6C80_02412 [Aureobasidium pullulans]